MSINIDDYKKTYNVAECAGITAEDIATGYNVSTIYDKFASWINTNFSDKLIAEVVEYSATSFRLEIKFVGFGDALTWRYGQYNTGSYYNSISCIDSSTVTSGRLNIERLSIREITGLDSVMYSFFDELGSVAQNYSFIVSAEYGLIQRNNLIAFLTDGSSPSLNTRLVYNGAVNSSQTLLANFFVNATILTDKVYVCDGFRVSPYDFYQIGDRVYANTYYNGSSNKAFAIRVV